MRRLAPVLLAVALLTACGGDDQRAAREASTAERPRSLPQSCSVVHRGAEPPSVLIVSTLPLQGPYVRDGVQGTTAIRMVLEERGYRAGDRAVGYVSCDEWAARPEDAPEKCAAGAAAYAGTRDVVGVIGPFFSSCAIVQLPILNRAPGGPLAAIGPGNTYVGLTRPGAGVPGDEPERFRPTGRPGFVRLAAPDDVQGQAHARQAVERGLARAYVLTDGVDAYSAGTAAGFRDAARELGLEVVGEEKWDAEATGYAALARRVERSRADAVFFGGYLFSNGGRLLRDLRERLGPAVQFMAPEAFLPIEALARRAGAAAEGMAISLSSVANERLEGPGKAFLERFRDRLDQDPCCYTVHAAQAAHALLDAIAASDGTRTSVTARLLDLRVRDGIIGSFAFDENGDITPGLVTMYRVEEGELQFVEAVSGS